jgi:serine/threonine protein kinase/tetratricopeptide (TPR) repeat protein
MGDLRIDADSELARDDAIERVLAVCLQSEPTERAAALERACSTHPEFATVLRQRWSALAAMGLVEPLDALAQEPTYPEQLGDFRLLQRLGGGGMGVVFLAVQTSLGREVALKLVRPEQLYFPRAKERFRREAEAIAKLAHPGIVPIHTVGEENGVPFFSMELIRGCTLAAALARLSGRAPESLNGRDLERAIRAAAGVDLHTPPHAFFERGWVDTCLALVRQVADALEHAHGRGLIHRDVKPSNVMVAPDGRARLVDFGLTAIAEVASTTRTGAQLGTLHYMAPEQVRGSKDLDARADVYGLGVTLYELLSLQLPFRGEDALEVQRAILDGRADSLRARNRSVPADVEIVCAVAMERDPSRRYASAGAFAHDVFNLLEHRPIAARPLGALVRSRRWAQRRPAMATSIVLGTLLLVGTPIALNVLQHGHLNELRAAAAEQNRETKFLFEAFTHASSSTPNGPLSVSDVADYGARTVDAAFFDQPWLATRSLVFLGRLFHHQRLPAKAVPLFERAIEIGKDPRTPFLHQHPNEAALYLAESLIALREFERAAELAQNAGDFFRATFPDRRDRIDYADTLLAQAWLGAGRIDEGTALTQRLLEAARAESGSDSEDFAFALCTLARAYYASGDVARAAELWQSALPTLRAKLGATHANLATVLVNIGTALKRQGRLDDAAPYFEEALSMMRRLWREPNVTLGEMLVNYAAFEEARGHLDVAEENYRDAVATLSRVQGPENRGIVAARGGLAGVCARLGRCAEAEELYAEVLPLQERVLAPDDPKVGFSLQNLAKCAAERGDREAAREYLRRAIERWRACAGGDELIAGAQKELDELGTD